MVNYAARLDELPDDVLLEVMRYVGADDLLECRLVCRRLGGLALHPQAWRHRRLDALAGGDADEQEDEGDDFYRRACPVLRLAPRLAYLRVGIEGRHEGCDMLTATRCAVEELVVTCAVSEPSGAEAARLVQRQELLGRLRRLTIRADLQTFATDLFRTLLSTSGLECLALIVQNGSCPVVVRTCMPKVSVPSTLKKLQLEFPNCREVVAAFFVNKVLSTHASTLETVHFGGVMSTKTARLLAAMPRLRELAYQLQPSGGTGKAPVTSNSLSVLRITATPVGEITAFDAAQEDVDVRFLAFLLFFRMENLEAFRPVLEGLSPASAPSLRRLVVDGCAHEWVHNATVRALLRSNPSLHVWVDGAYMPIRSGKLGCGVCHVCRRLDCHKQFGDAMLRRRYACLFLEGHSRPPKHLGPNCFKVKVV